MAAIRDHIRFILNGDDIALKDVGADETLLDFLRLRRSLRGTKEGCAEGDCGACTVLVGRQSGDGIAYEAVNACIRFVGSLDGCHVVTVEHLRGADGDLHPVQQAMVDFHGSQCGFCTPGFVMSLYALWMHTPQPSDAAIEKALQGNLCRCTGYEAIVRAARAISDYGKAADDPLAAERADIMGRLAAMADGQRVEVGSGSRRFVLPADLDDLVTVLEAEPSATIVAGATDVGLWVTKFMREIAPVVFIGNLEELKRVEVEEDRLSIGAAVSYTAAFAALTNHVPELARLIDRIGGEQVRNMGTIGGNIANGSPIGDMPPPLIALGTTLHLRKGRERRALPLEDFFLDYSKQDRWPGEFVERIEVPIPPTTSHFSVYKVTKRRDEDITAALGAFHLVLDGRGKVDAVRIAYGGMAGVPKRARAVETALLGQPWTREAVERAMEKYDEDFTPLSDMRASADYRLTVSRNLLLRFFLETSGTRKPVTVGRERAA